MVRSLVATGSARPALEAPLASETPDATACCDALASALGHAQERPPDLSARPSMPVRYGLQRFNTAPFGAVESALLACCGSQRWAARITAHRPYPTVDALLAAASEASYDMSPDDLAEALADESRVPQPVLGLRAPACPAAQTALRAAHAAYERRFGHVFVFCPEGVAPDEVLDEVLGSLRTRLGNPPEAELAVVAEQLRRMAILRLAHLVTDPSETRPPHDLRSAIGG